MNSKQICNQSDSSPQGIHIVAKPIGPACNLDCEYCFYLEKQALYGAGEDYRMPTGRTLISAGWMTNWIATAGRRQ